MCLTVFSVPPPSAPVRARRRHPRRRLRTLFASTVAATIGLATLVAVPGATPVSQATSTYLCTGYTACDKAGYSHAGYAQNNKTMYWRMYAGHNCTNYVAYRMIQKGMPNERPWSGGGNATYWGTSMKDITDTTPAVGAVAWWKANAPGAGSSGHVAYVEKVVSSTEIVISEDSWSGDFHWRTIYKTGSGWPTGFIHFVDQQVPALTNTKLPSFNGAAPTVGTPIRGFYGNFKPKSAQALQWMVDGVAVPGATATTYTPAPADLGKTITLRTTATKAGYTSSSAVSTASAPVASGSLGRVAKPSVSGFPEVGSVLTAVPGTWSPGLDSSVFRWRADGVWLGEALNGPTLTLSRDLVDKNISVVEIAKRQGYKSSTNASANVGPVVSGVIELTEPFRASGVARYGSQLVFTPGTWAPADATATYQWFRDGAVVPGVTSNVYPLGAADVGHRITVRSVVAKDRWQGLARTADYGVVTTPSAIRMYAGGRKRGAVARVRITAPGVAAPTGVAWAKIGDHVVRGEVVDGKVELKLEGLVQGTKTMLVLFEGAGVVENSRAYAKVIVKPGKTKGQKNKGPKNKGKK